MWWSEAAYGLFVGVFSTCLRPTISPQATACRPAIRLAQALRCRSGARFTQELRCRFGARLALP